MTSSSLLLTKQELNYFADPGYTLFLRRGLQGERIEEEKLCTCGQVQVQFGSALRMPEDPWGQEPQINQGSLKTCLTPAHMFLL